MIMNMAYMLPLVGRVTMGELVRDSDGSKPRPVKHDYFRITSQAKAKGAWVSHPIEAQIKTDEEKKLRVIPIKVLFDNPDLSISESYVAFDEKGRQLCRGNGEKANCIAPNGKREEIVCLGPDHCQAYCGSRCSLLGRFHFSISTDEKPCFEAFALRTSGYNSIRAIRAKLELFAAAFGGLQGLPLKLVLRAKSSKASYGANFYYADIELGCEFWDGSKLVKEFKDKAADAGVNLEAMENAYAKLSEGNVQETVDDVEELEEIGAGQFLFGKGWGDCGSGEGEGDPAPTPSAAQSWQAAGLALIKEAKQAEMQPF